MRLLLTVATLFLSFVPPCFGDATQPSSQKEAVVGNRTIIIPAPAGFQRVDGIDPDSDRMAESFIPKTNRYVARFEPLPENSAYAGRSLNVQVLRSAEKIEIGETTFAESKEQIKAELKKAQETLKQELKKQFDAAGKKLSEEIDADVALTFSDAAVLGTFDDSPNSLGFTLAMNFGTKIGDKSKVQKGVVASMLVPINGRLLYLYANADFKSPEDRLWAEKSVSAWRDSLLGANPRVAGPSGSFFSGAGRSALIGAAIGGLVALVMTLIKKFGKA